MKAGSFVVVTWLALMTLSTLNRSVAAQELVGHGDWQSLSGGEHISGNWAAKLRRTDSQLVGTMELTGSNVLKGGSG